MQKQVNLLQDTAQKSLALNHSRTQQLSTSQGQDQHQGSSKLSHSSYITGLHVLPVELLAHIFTFCQAEAPDKSFLPYPSWLPITHVCHRWRTVALSHGQLWTSVTCGLPLRWIKAFMERSGTMLMDFDIHVAPGCRDYHFIAPLLTNLTRVRSLCLTGCCDSIFPVIDSLRSSLLVQRLSLCLEDKRSGFIIPDNLFGGDAPVRHLQLAGDHIFAPHWFLRGVTHFTTTGSNFPELLNALCHMSALTYFEFQSHSSCYMTSVPPNILPIQMPQLKNLIVGASSPHEFMLLNQLLLSHVGAKRRLELQPVNNSLLMNMGGIEGLSPVVEAANGFRHIHFSGVQENPIIRLWTGNVGTTWEDAEFCVSMKSLTSSEFGMPREDTRCFIRLCDALGAADVRRLAIDSLSPALQKSFWWSALAKLRGIEELELHPTGVEILGDAWRVNLAPTVFPELRRVWIVDSELDRPLSQYAILRAGKRRERRIVRLPSSTEDDVPVEKEIENMSKGFLRLLQGLGRHPKWALK